MDPKAWSGPVSLPLGQIRRCSADPVFCEAVAKLYAELDAAIAVLGATCRNRGACCRFGEFGHRLFVTPVELAYFLARVKAPCRSPSQTDVCPYHERGRCASRPARPAGCRIFFCDPRAQEWQPPLSERTLVRLKALHDRFSLPYAYAEWIQALAALSAI